LPVAAADETGDLPAARVLAEQIWSEGEVQPVFI
jgi:hypothetical protein